MQGQDELVAQLKSHSISTLPHTIMLVGESGCGKHTLANELAEHFNLPLEDITSSLSYDMISEIQLRSYQSFYLINLSQMTEKTQNVILKFVEEPSHNAYIILITDTLRGILDTIINRCMIFNFMPYNAEVLKCFLEDGESEEALKYCKTPGQIRLAHSNIGEMSKLVNTIIHKLGNARFDNALTIVNKINYKDEYDKYDINIFLNVILDNLEADFVENGTNLSFKLYNIVKEYRERLFDVRLNREILMESMIIKMWRTAKDEMSRTKE